MRVSRALLGIALFAFALMIGPMWTTGTTHASALKELSSFEQLSESAHKASYAELVFHHLRYEGQSVYFKGKLLRVFHDDSRMGYNYELIVQVYGTPDIDASSKRFNLVHLAYLDIYDVPWDSLPEGTEIEFVATMISMVEIELGNGDTVTRPLMVVEYVRLT